MNNNQKNTRPQWPNIFIEIALRALLKLHHEYIIWANPNIANNKSNIKDLNQGQGIEFADERTVCAAITQEFIYSSYTSGKLFAQDTARKGGRYWRIYRELPYCKGSRQILDIRVERYNPRTNEAIGGSACIEAKRINRWVQRLENNDGVTRKPTPIEEIEKDINKLNELCQKEKRNGNDRDPLKAWLLLWNIVDIPITKNNDKPDYIKKKFNLGEQEIRWAPLSWENDNPNTCEKIKITKALWVSLVEIKKT